MSEYVARQLGKKLRLESMVKGKIRRYLSKLNREAVAEIRENGAVPIMAQHRAELAGILRDHYKAVIEAFTGDAVETITKSLKDIETKALELPDVSGDVVAQAEAIANTRADKQAEIITNTSQAEADAALLAAVAAGVASADREVGRTLARRLPDRVETVATYETQFMAEATKQTEADVLAVASVAVGAAIMKKKWNTMLDEKTRDSHVLADGQVRRVIEGYTVQGQTLMFPGDMSHGATLDNVIHCRCSSRYFV